MTALGSLHGQSGVGELGELLSRYVLRSAVSRAIWHLPPAVAAVAAAAAAGWFLYRRRARRRSPSGIA